MRTSVGSRRRRSTAATEYWHPKGRSHRGCRLFTVDLLNGTTAYVLVVIEHASRRVRSFGQAAPRKPLPGAVADLDAFRARRRDLIGGVIREYAQVA